MNTKLPRLAAIGKKYLTIALVVGIPTVITGDLKADQPVLLVGTKNLETIVSSVADTFRQYNLSKPRIDLKRDGLELKFFCSKKYGQYPDIVVSLNQLSPRELRTCSSNKAGKVVEHKFSSSLRKSASKSRGNTVYIYVRDPQRLLSAKSGFSIRSIILAPRPCPPWCFVPDPTE